MISPRLENRVSRHTAECVNEHIHDQMIQRLRYYADHPEDIEDGLAQLSREWDIERVLEANASALALTGLVLGSTVDRRWYLLSAGVMGFLFQHALQGWCPPVPILRRLGVRTQEEIDVERDVLKALRGDFSGLEGIAGAASREARIQQIHDLLDAIER